MAKITKISRATKHDALHAPMLKPELVERLQADVDAVRAQYRSEGKPLSTALASGICSRLNYKGGTIGDRPSAVALTNEILRNLEDRIVQIERRLSQV